MLKYWIRNARRFNKFSSTGSLTVSTVRPLSPFVPLSWKKENQSYNSQSILDFYSLTELEDDYNVYEIINQNSIIFFRLTLPVV